MFIQVATSEHRYIHKPHACMQSVRWRLQRQGPRASPADEHKSTATGAMVQASRRGGPLLACAPQPSQKKTAISTMQPHGNLAHPAEAHKATKNGEAKECGIKASRNRDTTGHRINDDAPLCRTTSGNAQMNNKSISTDTRCGNNDYGWRRAEHRICTHLPLRLPSARDPSPPHHRRAKSVSHRLLRRRHQRATPIAHWVTKT